MSFAFWRRASAAPSAVRIVLRQSPDWRHTPHAVLLEGSRAFCRAVGAATGLPENFIADAVAVWDRTFAQSYFELRAALKDIARDNLHAVHGATHATLETTAAPAPAGRLDVFIDDDDWLHPDLCRRLAPFVDGSDGYVFGNVLCESRVQLRRVEDGCYTNNYAVAGAYVDAAGVARVAQHWDAHAAFLAPGFRRRLVEQYVSATNKHPASAMKLKDGLGTSEPPTPQRLRELIERYVDESADAPLPDAAEWIRPYRERVRAQFAALLVAARSAAPVAGEREIPAPENDLERFFHANTGREIHKWKHYFEVYERHFHRFRGRPITVLEIGVGQGGSLAMWQQYFGPQATIIGVDNNPECLKLERPGQKIFIGDQEDRAFLRRLRAEIPHVDVLIDDGGHHMGQQIATFEELFAHVDAHGVYLCEDLHTSYWEKWGGGYRKPGTFIEFAKALVDRLNAWHSLEADVFDVDEITRSAHSLHFYDSILVVEKRPLQAPQPVRSGQREIAPHPGGFPKSYPA